MDDLICPICKQNDDLEQTWYADDGYEGYVWMCHQCAEVVTPEVDTPEKRREREKTRLRDEYNHKLEQVEREYTTARAKLDDDYEAAIDRLQRELMEAVHKVNMAHTQEETE